MSATVLGVPFAPALVRAFTRYGLITGSGIVAAGDPSQGGVDHSTEVAVLGLVGAVLVTLITAVGGIVKDALADRRAERRAAKANADTDVEQLRAVIEWQAEQLAERDRTRDRGRRST